jgi:hypothetical protein
MIAGWHAILEGETECVCGHDFPNHIYLGSVQLLWESVDQSPLMPP